MVIKNNNYKLPNANIQILAPKEELDFFDTQSIQLFGAITPLEAWGFVLSQPKPMLKFAFWIRDSISSMFGAKKIQGFSGIAPNTVEVGQMLDFFLVEFASEEILVLTNRDKHLDVMTCISTSNNRLSITSSVKTHNTFGLIYMIPVAPIHRLIVRKDLKMIGLKVKSTSK